MHWCVAERKGRLEKEKDSRKHPRVRVGCNETERNGRTDRPSRAEDQLHATSSNGEEQPVPIGESVHVLAHDG